MGAPCRGFDAPSGVLRVDLGRAAPPTERTQNGLWDLSAMETGSLVFNFTLDPHAYKAEMSKINKLLAAAADSGKPITNPVLMKPKPKENISVKTMARAQTQAS